MSFQKAAEQMLHLTHAWKVGLHALRKEDRPHIDAEDTRKLTGSVDVDTPLAKIYPHANRWDFGIAYQHTDRQEEVVYWTELHTASDGEVKVVIAKAQWLLACSKARGIGWPHSRAKLFGSLAKDHVHPKLSAEKADGGGRVETMRTKAAHSQ